MDLEILFWILILLAPLLSRFLKAQKRKQQGPPPKRQPQPQDASAERELTPFEEALRQIQEALTESQRPAPPEPEPVKPGPVRRETVRPEKPRQRVEPAPAPWEFHEHAAPTYEEKPEFYDDRFEKEAPYTSPGRDEHYHAPLSDDSDTPVPSTRGRAKELTRWQRTIANIELLSPPRSRRPWKSPWGK